MKHLKILAPVLLVLLAVGCARIPQAEIDQAKAALDAAKTAEAALYAPQALQDAEAAVQAIDAAVQAKNFKQAGEQAVQAKSLAEKAAADAAAGKEQVKGEVTQLLAELPQSFTDLEALAAKAKARRGVKVDFNALGAEMEAGKAAFAEIQADFDAGKFADAKTKALAVKEKVAAASDLLSKSI